jgi:hypothetical protein
MSHRCHVSVSDVVTSSEMARICYFPCTVIAWFLFRLCGVNFRSMVQRIVRRVDRHSGLPRLPAPMKTRSSRLSSLEPSDRRRCELVTVSMDDGHCTVRPCGDYVIILILCTGICKMLFLKRKNTIGRFMLESMMIVC